MHNICLRNVTVPYLLTLLSVPTHAKAQNRLCESRVEIANALKQKVIRLVHGKN